MPILHFCIEQHVRDCFIFCCVFTSDAAIAVAECFNQLMYVALVKQIGRRATAEAS